MAMQTPDTGMTAYERGYMQGRAGLAVTIAVSQGSAYAHQSDEDDYMTGWADGVGDSKREPVKVLAEFNSAQRRRARRRHLQPAAKEELEQWDF